MFYNNAVCDGCGEPLCEGEDIVVCPVCGTPQHRRCYELNNKCVNEHLHSEGFAWQNPDAPEEPEKKPESTEYTEPIEGNAVPTGIPMPALDVNPVFFQNAGIDPESEFDGVKAKEAVSYTQIGAKSYARKFIRSDGKKYFLSWNWGAFLLAPAWFFYRKLYKVGFIFLGLMVAVNLLLYPTIQTVSDAFEPIIESREEYAALFKDAMENPTDEKQAELEKQTAEAQKIVSQYTPQMLVIFLLQSIIPHVASALIANSFYKQKMLEDIKKARKLSDDQRVVKYAILRSGGVAFLPAAAALMAESYLPEMILRIINYFILK